MTDTLGTPPPVPAGEVGGPLVAGHCPTAVMLTIRRPGSTALRPRGSARERAGKAAVKKARNVPVGHTRP
ncbi:hypothetical protein [Nonomuraea sp. LPB2021202275-12-8]|uniref:hypothetical protein n=1 Tax=Nonomuraea sp. LPB2021202275-12-8 TaxID=3120159 RepID=UPI00300CF2BF